MGFGYTSISCEEEAIFYFPSVHTTCYRACWEGKTDICTVYKICGRRGARLAKTTYRIFYRQNVKKVNQREKRGRQQPNKHGCSKQGSVQKVDDMEYKR